MSIGLGLALLVIPPCTSCNNNEDISEGIVSERMVVDTIYYTIENHAVESFLKSDEYKDDDYSYSFIEQYYEPDIRNDLPNICELKWQPDSEKIQKLLLTKVEDNTVIIESLIESEVSSYILADLIPGNHYSAKIVSFIFGEWKTMSEWYICPTGKERMIKTESCWNIRDLGGWTTREGRKVKYGIMFRGSEFTGSHGIEITQRDKEYLTSMIDVELDLRGEEERNLQDNNPDNDIISSALGGQTKYKAININAYSKGIKQNGAQFKKCFIEILNNIRAGQSIYFHCWAGADRTGTLAYLLLGTLGVSESDLCKEYELSSYSPLIKSKSGFRLRNSEYFPFSEFVTDIKSYGQGCVSINTCIENYWKSVGISDNEIKEFKQLLLE